MADLEKLLRLEEWAQDGGTPKKADGTRKQAYEYGMWARETVCGTFLCLAGKVAADSGVRFLWNEGGSARNVMDPDGRPVSIQAWAASELGITTMESFVLFSPDRNVDLDERCALEFLSHLITRARKSLPSMADREVLDWMNAFYRKHDPENAEEDEKEEQRWG